MKDKSGILAQRVEVRPYVAWHVRLIIIVIVVALLLAISWFMYNAGSKSSMVANKIFFDAESYLSYDASTCLKKEKKELCTQTAGLVRQLQMNRGLYEDLAEQVKTLGEENNQLKEELAFFQHLLSDKNDTSPGVSIHRFDLRKGKSAGEYRYTLLLVQGGQQPTDFEGNLKLQVTLRQNKVRKTIPLKSKNASGLFSVNFKFYQRIQESFQVPTGAIVENLQVQVFEKDKTSAKLTQTIEPSS